MDCRGDELIQHNRTSTQAVPFQYLINEQAKSILALQELQNEVGALLEFRDLVMDTFPHLRQKQVSSPEPSSGSQGVGSGESRWEPGVRVRRKLGSSSGWIAGGGGGLATAAAVATVPRSRSNSHGKGPKSGEPATTSVGTVQDSGFCTESKDSSSTSSRTTTKNCCKDEDELWSLLEVIQDKGTKLKLEVEFLQSRLLDDEHLQRRRWRKQRLRRCRSLDDLLSEDCKRSASCDDGKRLSPAIADDYCNYNVFRAHVTDLKRERDALLDRVTEMEAESLSNAAQIHRLLTELKLVVCENKELEERLCGGKLSSAATTLRKSSSHNGVGFAPVQPESSTGPSSSSAGRDAYYTPSQHSACNLSSIELCKQCSSSYTDTDDDRHRSRMLLVRPSDPISRNLEGQAPSLLPTVDIGSPTFAKRLGLLDGIVSSPGDRIGKPIPGCGTAPGTPLPKRTLAAILKTFNPIELQRHLITVSYENKNLVRQVETLNKSKCDISNELNKSKEDNEELKFQLEEKRIELEGTMARVRLLQLHQEQHQHGSVTEQSGATGITTTATNQWLDLVPSNPILPQIALPGTPSAAVVTSSHHLQNHHNHRHHQDENGGDGSSSTESAHQARSGGRHSQPSKIPVVKPSYSVSRPPSSYREHHHTPRDPYPSWNKCKSDQSLPRNWDPIHNKSNGGSGSSIGSGGKQRGSNKQDSLHDYNGHAGKHLHHRARKDSCSGGVASLTRARSQNHHQRTAAAVNSTIKDRTGGTITAVIASQVTVDDTNKLPMKKIYRRRSLSRQTRSLIDNKKPVLPAVDEVQEPPDSLATAAARLRDRDDGDQNRVFQNGDCDGHRIFQDDDDRLLQDDDDEEFFFDSIESSLATSASSRRPPPECDSIDLSHPDSPLPTG